MSRFFQFEEKCYQAIADGYEFLSYCSDSRTHYFIKKGDWPGNGTVRLIGKRADGVHVWEGPEDYNVVIPWFYKQ